jgi:hypothetical protein
VTDLDSAGATRAPCVAASRISRPHEDSVIVSCSNGFDTDDLQTNILKFSKFLDFRRKQRNWKAFKICSPEFYVFGFVKTYLDSKTLLYVGHRVAACGV